MMTKKIIVIGAISRGGVYAIEKDGKFVLPWKSRKDVDMFRKITAGYTVIMDHNTCESINLKPLSGRENIVISGDSNFNPEGFVVVHSLEEAIRRARNEKVFVVGNSVVWVEAIPLADEIILTIVDCKISTYAKTKTCDELLSIYKNNGAPDFSCGPYKKEMEDTVYGSIRLEFLHYYRNKQVV